MFPGIDLMQAAAGDNDAIIIQRFMGAPSRPIAG